MPLLNIKCLNAKYSETTEEMILDCLVEGIDGRRVFILNRSDFHYKSPDNSVPHQEMYRTADLFRGKKFRMDMRDSGQQLSPAQELEYSRMFAQEVGNEMEKVAEGLADSDGKIQRKVGRILDKENVNLEELLRREVAIRARLGK